MGSAVRYPFIPKSNRYLAAGQYWALPLREGRFACGRVLAVPAFGARDRVGVVIGLMDWLGPQPPAAGQIAGHQLLDQGKSRFEAISGTGGQVLGLRPLELDGLVAGDPDAGTVHRVWGWSVILDLAEQYFG